MSKPKSSIAKLDRNGEIAFTTKGRWAFIAAITFVLFAGGLGWYSHQYYRHTNSVTGTIQTTAKKVDTTKHIVDITDESSQSITSIVNNGYKNGYDNVYLVIYSDDCSRCQSHKDELADVINKTADDKNLVLLANYAFADIKAETKQAFNMPEHIHFPTIIQYNKEKQEDGSRQDRLNADRTNLFDYYEVIPLFQNKDIYYG